MSEKKIIKNTIVLYIRMIVIMAVTLYTSRIVLDVLGVIDFGIYNIVGSVVVSLVFIQNTLISSSQRFFSYYIGRRDDNMIMRVFSMNLNIHILFIVIIVLLLETIGLWFLNNILSIPEDKIPAANVVYQLSIATFCLNILRIPYNAMIISYERMNIFAICSIVEAMLKLLIVYFLLVVDRNKLIIYALLIFLVSFIVNTIYIIYCRIKFRKVTNYSFIRDSSLFREMIGFSGWNLLGGATGVATNEGPNYFMNVYLGVTINASMGIAKQVSTAVYHFTSNFQMAFNPQIVKLYASGKMEELYSLIIRASNISFYLLLIISLPITVNANYIFNLWLVKVPSYAVEFSVLMLIAQLVAAISSPLWMTAHAIGTIRNYQIAISVISLMILPLAWLLLLFNYNPQWILLCNIFINAGIFVYRIIYLKHKLNLPVKKYTVEVVQRCSLVTLLSLPVPLICTYLSVTSMINIVLTTMTCGFIIYNIGLDIETKRKIADMTYRIFTNIVRK